MYETIDKMAGGKAREFQYIKPLIPAYERYIEPFFDGGAVFFSLPPQTALIDLMQCYEYVKRGDADLRASSLTFIRLLRALYLDARHKRLSPAQFEKADNLYRPHSRRCPPYVTQRKNRQLLFYP